MTYICMPSNKVDLEYTNQNACQTQVNAYFLIVKLVYSLKINYKVIERPVELECSYLFLKNFFWVQPTNQITGIQIL